MTVCKMYGKSLFILQSTRKEGLGLKACCQIFFLCCKALPYIFRKKTKQIPRHNVFMLIFKLSQACCVVVAYVFLKSFCIVRAFGAYLFPFFFVSWAKKRVSNFCNADFAFWTLLILQITLYDLGKQRSRIAQEKLNSP